MPRDRIERITAVPLASQCDSGDLTPSVEETPAGVRRNVATALPLFTQGLTLLHYAGTVKGKQ